MVLPSRYRDHPHPCGLLNIKRECKACELGKGLAVGGSGPDSLNSIRLIVISDHIGAYESKCNYNFYPNDEERAPKVTRRTGARSLEGYRNAGSMLRYTLQDMFGLDTYSDCWMTNAIKCDPAQTKPKELHVKLCTSTWLKDELAILDQHVPEVPMLIAGNLALKSLHYIAPELKLPGLQDCRRSTEYKLGLHPLVFTVNPAAVARSEWRVEDDVALSPINKYQVRRVRVINPPIPASPVWLFQQDLEVLRNFL